MLRRMGEKLGGFPHISMVVIKNVTVTLINKLAVSELNTHN